MPSDSPHPGPTFFIVGSVKSGTTALYSYLRKHPAIFMPSIKDVNYFSEDFPGIRSVTSLKDYEALFPPSESTTRTIGEASSLYLYSNVAIRRIHEYNPRAKLIAMLRNPIDLVSSFHNQLLYSQEEDEPNLEKAWRLQEQRANGEAIPARCTVPQQLQYGAVAKLGEQVTRMLTSFPREQVLLVLHDDFCADPAAVYRDVLRHLEVEDDGRTNFERVNVRSEHRSKALGRLTEQPPEWLRAGVRGMKRILGVERLGVFDAVRKVNVKATEAEPIPQSFREELEANFREDVDKLATMLDRDLSGWLSRSSVQSA